MDKKDPEIMLDVCAKFFKYVRIEGWLASNFYNNCSEDEVQSIELPNFSGIYEFEVGVSSPGIGIGLNKGFVINIFGVNEFPHNLEINFILKNNLIFRKNIDDLCTKRIQRYKSLSVTQKFKDLIGGKAKILDVGGRDRSKLDRSKYFENEIVVVDILDGKNVDVVGDAHGLGKIFHQSEFDAVMSICVFEHLAMPWKVVSEINKILRINGYVLIYTHQTIGLHDLPWDYFRFSEDVWDVFFNRKTGFRIVDKGSDFEQFIIPFIYHKAKKDAEKSAGREASWVIAQKVSDVDFEYNLEVADFTKTVYPKSEDGNDPTLQLI